MEKGKKQEVINQVLAYLAINSSYLTDIGLFYGRMGIILFFVRYARISGLRQYEYLAEMLLEEIYKEIHKDMPIQLASGLCGIGWGIEYLVRNGFMTGDTDKILKDIDQRVMEYDPKRMKDLSFREGLTGIVFYVLTRLSAPRQTKTCPFDSSYLDSLRIALRQAEFSKTDEVPLGLISAFFQCMDGLQVSYGIDGSFLDDFANTIVWKTDFERMPMGICDGLAGILWQDLIGCKTGASYLNMTGKRNLYLFAEKCRGQNYGIGTYISQLMTALDKDAWNVYVVHLKSDRTKSVEIGIEQGIHHIYLGDRHRLGYKNNYAVELRQYYQVLSAVLSPFLCDNSVFHFNYIQIADLAVLLKKFYPGSKTVFTVHYTEWSFALLGDRSRLENMFENHEHTYIEDSVCENVSMWRYQLGMFDQIVAIARHSYKDLVEIYKVPKEKIRMIPHGIEDKYKPLGKEERLDKRRKYGFCPEDRILLFAGRIDQIKGVMLLAKAFLSLKKKYPKLKLVIAGDGNFNELLQACRPGWSDYILTGFVNKETLYELYSISDIGVLPSLHEEFGYIALEMMMMRLPVIAGKTTGLSELIIENETGCLIDWVDHDSFGSQNTALLEQSITMLIEDGSLCLKYAENGRKRYISNYSIDVFKNSMKKLYEFA